MNVYNLISDQGDVIYGTTRYAGINKVLFNNVICDCQIVGYKNKYDLLWIKTQDGVIYKKRNPGKWVKEILKSTRLCYLPFGLCNIAGVYAISQDENSFYLFRSEQIYLYITVNDACTYITSILFPGQTQLKCYIPVFSYGEDVYEVYYRNRSSLYYESHTYVYDMKGNMFKTSETLWYPTNQSGQPSIRSRFIDPFLDHHSLVFINNKHYCCSGFCEYSYDKSIRRPIVGNKLRSVPFKPLHDTFCHRLAEAIEGKEFKINETKSVEYCPTCNHVNGVWTYDKKYIEASPTCACDHMIT